MIVRRLLRSWVVNVCYNINMKPDDLTIKLGDQKITTGIGTVSFTEDSPSKFDLSELRKAAQKASRAKAFEEVNGQFTTPE